MIIVLKPKVTKKEIEKLSKALKEKGLSPFLSRGKERTIIGVIGDERKLQEMPLEIFPGVEKVMPILKPYKLVSRDFQKENTVIDFGGRKIGGKRVEIIAGPCSVEDRESLFKTAEAVKAAGCFFLRGGAFKPRTSPYAFQGLGEEGLKLLADAKKEFKMAVVTELMDPRDIEVICRYADVIQIGARNMQNFRLLKEVGMLRKPVLLKRGLANTIKELLMSAEYIASEGNLEIILCERGIRTYETETRNTLDLSAVPVLKKLTHLPVIVDPSHGTGRWDMVDPLAKAAVAVGADGLLIEVHSNPEKALCDGDQSLKPKKFAQLVKELRKVAKAIGRDL